MTTQNTSDVQEKEQYWDGFYASKRRAAPRVPSQFAAFAANELTDVPAIVEFGCGNGRDAEFFGLCGFHVLAMDASSEAVEVCRTSRRQSSVTYECSEAGASTEFLRDFVAKHPQVCVYGRFFLHAITPEQQDRLLDVLTQVLPAGAMLAFEYRTTKDAEMEKAFGTHYRRFLDHAAFVSEMSGRGFDVLYDIEGQGMAKYKSEDAHVGRVLLKKR